MKKSSLVDKISRDIIRRKYLIIVIVFVITFIMALCATRLNLEQRLEDIYPKGHSYTLLNSKFHTIFGGNNMISIGIFTKDKTIFTRPFLSLVRRMTRDILRIDGVVPYRVVSLSSRKLRYITTLTDPEFPKYPTMENVSFEKLVSEALEDESGEKLSQFRRIVLKDSNVFGKIVSKDEKGTIIQADFSDVSLGRISKSLHDLVNRYQSPNISIHVVGRPVALNRLESHTHHIIYIFGFAAAISVLLLYAAFKTKRGVLVPLIGGVTTVIWNLGLAGIAGIRLDFFCLTVPFIAFIIAISHAVQLVKRYYEEYYKCHDTGKASSESLRHLIVPACTAIATDSIGFGSLAIFPFRVIRSMGIISLMGILSMVITVVLLLPCVLAMLPPPPPATVEKEEKKDVI